MLNKPFVKRAVRFCRVVAMVAAAILAVAIVTSVMIDLGGCLADLRARAERAGSDYLDRPMHIGGLHFRLYRGTFVVEDLSIEGLQPGDRPFLRAKRIEVGISWPALLNREVLLQSIEMSDWEMLAERFRDGRHNFPRFVRQSSGGGPGAYG